MDDRKDITKCVSRIWRMYRRQESLFKVAMCLELPFRIRKLVSNGFMVSILFKKELRLIYDAVKCNMSDGDLSSINLSVDHSDTAENDQSGLISKLSAEQDLIIEEYEKLLARLDAESEAAHTCREHLEKLNNLNRNLAHEASELPSNKTDYVSVA